LSDTTHELARFIVDSGWKEIPANVRHEAKRALLNWLACALGGCNDVTVDTALAALRDFSGAPHGQLIGRRERLDILNAAVVNAISSNVLDFDDTHLSTVIHPTVPVAAAVVALSDQTPVTGAQFLHAFILGVEAECRIGLAVTPEHYNAGWHITATCGVFGAAAACGKLLKLNAQQMTWALGIAATQSSGLTEMLGSMAKTYNMGHAARNGLMAALLARQGFTSSERALEAPRGFAHVLSPRCDLDSITRGLGTTWELTQNAYKPYPCGIVVHPIIDACLELRNQHGIVPDVIDSIDLRVHPLVLTLTGNPAPRNGLEAKLSVQHCAAAACIFGAAGVKEFSDACVNHPATLALRSRVRPVVDNSIGKDAADVTVSLKDGTKHHCYVAHASGSLERPLSDDDIESKFRALAEWGFSTCNAYDVIELIWSFDNIRDAAALARTTVPSASAVARG
jgi:2-methylcitrate dehydratase PrpD